MVEFVLGYTLTQKNSHEHLILLEYSTKSCHGFVLRLAMYSFLDSSNKCAYMSRHNLQFIRISSTPLMFILPETRTFMISTKTTCPASTSFCLVLVHFYMCPGGIWRLHPVPSQWGCNCPHRLTGHLRS